MNRFLLNTQVLVLLFLLKIPDLYSQPFVEQTGITLAGVDNSSVAWGDYDNDGDLDILLTGDPAMSRIYRNDGNNIFTWQDGIDLTPVRNSSVVWGDYDNDGDLDILLTGIDNGGRYISKIYRNNGDNTFTWQTGIALTGVGNSSVAWGDYDNDGDLDILLTGSAGDFTNYIPVSKIYRNDGNNSFTEQTSISLTEIWQSSIAWGDYDNDGDLDILLTGVTSSNQYTSKLYRNDGENIFTEQIEILLVGVSSGSSAMGDYDSDGDLDILLTGQNKSGQRISKIYSNNGDNSFTDQNNLILTGVVYSSIAWGDYDNDGNLDILITGQNSFGKEISKIYRNNGYNNLIEQTDITLSAVSNGSVAWCDYDNDGDLDILLTGSGISKVYRNEINTVNVKPSMPSNLQVVTNNGKATFTWDKTSDTETPQNGLNYNLYVYESGKTNYKLPPHAFRQSDSKNGRRLIAKIGNIQWSAAGYTLKNLLPDKTYYWSVQAVDAGLQGGSFSAEQSFIIPLYKPYVQADNISLSNLQTTQATAAWVNGGGTKRAVFIKATSTGTADPVDNTTYLVNGVTPGGWKCVFNGTAGPLILTGLALNTDYLIHVCEYNGAAGSEKYLKSSAYQNPALLSTVFTEQITLTGINSGSAAWGDYDKDGNLDILLTGATGDYTNYNPVSKIYRNNGTNSFTEQTGIILTGVFKSSAAWGDYDNDGDLDILLTGNNISKLPVSKIYRNNGNNTFTEQTQIVLTGVSNSSVSWGDYDNDGDLDILMTGWSGSGYISEIHRNNGDNSFTKQTGILLPGVYNSSSTWFDYNRDGSLDILLSGATQDFPNYNPISRIYKNEGNNIFTEQTDIVLTGVFNSSIALGDYNNDGLLDILLAGQNNSYQYISKVYCNNSDNSFTELINISLQGVTNSSTAWCDYDNDGDLDILLTGYTGSKYISSIYRNNGDSTFSIQPGIALTGVFYSSVNCGNYDNDGDQDLLLTGSKGLSSISKVFRNETINSNTKPSVPTGLESCWNNDTIIFKWNKSSDNSTPEEALNYNIRIGTSSGGNQIKSAQALSTTGILLLPNINPVNDTCVKFKLPFNKYYWTVQAIDNGGMASSFATEQITPLDSIQAKNLQGFVKSNNSLLSRWGNGNGLRRVLFGRLSSTSESAKPVDGIAYHAEPYFGQGDKIGTTGWFCLYNGIADSAIIYGIDEGYSYDLQVIEYIEVNGLPVYFNTIGNGNPGIFSSSLFSEQTQIQLDVYESSFAWGDYDSDGDLDILMTGETLSGQFSSKIYRNNSDNSFTEQTGISLTGVKLSDATWGDYDNDGNLDILLSGGFPLISKVYHNNGDNSFTEKTGFALTGVWYSSIAWGDYDNDGDLDILLTGSDNFGFNPISKIYKNNGNNSFTEQNQIVLTGVGSGSVTWGDYDNDGALDILLIGNTASYSISKIYRNNQDNTFTEQKSIVLTGGSNTSAAWGDYDNDGDLDILIGTNVYRNNGNNSFTRQTGIVFTGLLSGYGAWGDYDNDGDLDISFAGYTGSEYICKFYRNNGDNSFTGQFSAMLRKGSYRNSPRWGDFDNDGDLDILIGIKIYRNNTIMKAGKYPINKKPSAPGNLLATAQPGGTMLSWSPVKTDETPYKTMTYNVSISSTKLGTDICTPQADTSGYRQIVEMGNAQLDTTFLIKNLASTKFYWCVQAVDQGYAGGTWSAVDSFVVRNTQAFFKTDTVCRGLPTHFTDQSVATDGITSWKWSFNDGSFSSLQNPVHTYASNGTYNVRLVITSTAGDKDSLEQNVIIKARPITSFTAPNVCEGTTTSITNTTNINGLTISSWLWDFGDGQTSSVQQPGNHTYSLKGDYKAKLKTIATNSCADSINKDIVVAAIPNAAVSVNGKTTFCQGDSVQLIVKYDPLYAFQWKLDGNDLINTDTSLYTVKLNSGTYSVKVTNTQANCVATSNQTNVTVNPTPVSPHISASGPVQFCQGDSVILSVTNTAGYSYQWKLNNGAVGSNSSQYIAKTGGTYNLVVLNTNGCSVSSTNSVVVTVNSVPSISGINLSGPTTFCQGGSVTLSVPLTIGYTYNWRDEYGLISNANTNSYVVNSSGAYQLDISTASGCYARTSAVNVLVKPSPHKPVIGSVNYEKDKCPGENTITLNASQTVSEYQYQWYKDGLPLLNSILSKLDLSEKGNYKLEAILGGCKSESEVFNINFPEAPEKPFIYAQGPNVWYLACSNNTVSYYKWYCNDKLIEGADKYFYVANRRMGDYQVSIGNEKGCFTRSDVVTIPTGQTGIEDIDPFAGLKIYPNPTTGLFTVEMDNWIFGELSITIITEQGKEILALKYDKTTEHFSTEVDLNAQSKGLYFINLLIEKYFATRKVVVK
jgi:hypothetical protein